MSMTSYRGYLIRALNEWILDNDCTPYILVNAMQDEVDVPRQYVRDGQIVLNISPAAVHGLQVTNDMLSFSARFGGRPMEVFVPVSAVMGIYARENGQGMVFDAVELAAGSDETGERGTDADADADSSAQDVDAGPGVEGDEQGPDKGPDKPPRGGKRPNLRIVK